MAVKGEAHVKRSAELLNATNGMELLESDEIITQAKSRVQVVLIDPDGNVIVHSPPTTISLTNKRHQTYRIQVGQTHCMILYCYEFLLTTLCCLGICCGLPFGLLFLLLCDII